MKYLGRASISEFLGDNLLYRSLAPLDDRLPALDQLQDELGLPAGSLPRRTDKAYAQVIARVLKAAQELRAPGIPIERVLFIGDARQDDLTVFSSICRAGKWPGLAFFGDEDQAAAEVVVEEVAAGAVMRANRWAALAQFRDDCTDRGFEGSERTALLLNLEGTALGARGRNHLVIDRTWMEAAAQIVASALEERFDLADFQKTYDFFSQPRFQTFTTGSPDALVYICLVIGYGLFTRYGLKCALENEVITGFDSFLAQVDRRAVELPTGLKTLHQQVMEQFRLGDPTPFKTYHWAAYLAAVDRMGRMDAEAPVEGLLSQEIVITAEVQSLALAWREAGALVFGLSDRPGEASTPSPELAAQGYLPLHRLETSVVGG